MQIEGGSIHITSHIIQGTTLNHDNPDDIRYTKVGQSNMARPQQNPNHLQFTVLEMGMRNEYGYCTM